MSIVMSNYEALSLDVPRLGPVEVDANVSGWYTRPTWGDPGDYPEVEVLAVRVEDEETGEMVDLPEAEWMPYWDALTDRILREASDNG